MASHFSSSALAKLSPAYFGMVMATGIVSIGAWRLGLPALAWGTFELNLGIYLPLGMYATGTFEMANAMGFGFLGLLPKLFFGIALAAWAGTFAGLLHGLIKLAMGKSAQRP